MGSSAVTGGKGSGSGGVGSDLLADVIIKPDGNIRVVDLDELAEAFDRHLIDDAMLKKSLFALNGLLTEIYANGVSVLKIPLEKAIRENQ